MYKHNENLKEDEKKNNFVDQQNLRQKQNLFFAKDLNANKGFSLNDNCFKKSFFKNKEENQDKSEKQKIIEFVDLDEETIENYDFVKKRKYEESSADNCREVKEAYESSAVSLEYEEEEQAGEIELEEEEEQEQVEEIEEEEQELEEQELEEVELEEEEEQEQVEEIEEEEQELEEVELEEEEDTTLKRKKRRGDLKERKCNENYSYNYEGIENSLNREKEFNKQYGAAKELFEKNRSKSSFSKIAESTQLISKEGKTSFKGVNTKKKNDNIRFQNFDEIFFLPKAFPIVHSAQEIEALRENVIYTYPSKLIECFRCNGNHKSRNTTMYLKRITNPQDSPSSFSRLISVFDKEELNIQSPQLLRGSVRKANKCILNCSIEEMIKKLEKDDLELATVEKSDERRSAKHGKEDEILVDNQQEKTEFFAKTKKKQKVENKKEKKNELWVQKYAPKYFADLLSDEKVNREVLTWLKAWEFFVFNNNKSSKALEEKEELLKDHKRVLLLGGSPGIGKTTLVHVIAKHCKYDIIEVNASDDRNKDKISSLIARVVENDGGFTKSRPSLLILDEIDGAAASSGALEGEADDSRSTIMSIVSFINKKTKKGNSAIKRPIICICNDIWNRNLRFLRENAKVVYIQHPSEQLLKSRLLYICEKECIKANSSFINELIKLHKFDIRSTIHALQFISTNNSSSREATVFTAEHLHGYNAMKDEQKYQIDILRLIFNSNASNYKSSQEKQRRTENFDQIINLILNANFCLNAVQLCILVDENYRNISYNDPFIEKTSSLSELLTHTDCLLNSHFSSLSKYVSSHMSAYSILPLFLYVYLNMRSTNLIFQQFVLYSKSAHVIQKQRTAIRREAIKSITMRKSNLSAITLCGCGSGRVFSFEVAPLIASIICLNVFLRSPENEHDKDSSKLKSKFQVLDFLNVRNVIRKLDIVDVCTSSYGALMNKKKHVTSSSYCSQYLLYIYLKILRLMVTYGLSFISIFDNNYYRQKSIGDCEKNFWMCDTANSEDIWMLNPPLHLLIMFPSSSMNSEKKQKEVNVNQSLNEDLDRKMNTQESVSINKKICSMLNEDKLYFNSESKNYIFEKQILQFYLLDYTQFLSMQNKNSKNTEKAQKTCQAQHDKTFTSHFNIFDLLKTDKHLTFEEIIQREKCFSQQIVDFSLKLPKEVFLKKKQNIIDEVEEGQKENRSENVESSIMKGYIRFIEGRCNAVTHSALMSTF